MSEQAPPSGAVRVLTEPGYSNRGFLIELGKALLALMLGASLLLASFSLFSPEVSRYENAASRTNLKPWKINGADLYLRQGQGEKTTDNGLNLYSLAGELEGRSLLTRRTNLRASDFPFFEYNISGRHPGTTVYLRWRTAENTEETFNAKLDWSGDRKTVFHLGGLENWRGTITEIGLDIYGDLRGQPILIEELAASPYSTGSLLATIWSEWTLFETWNQASINNLQGTKKGALLSPTMAAISWISCALLILSTLRLTRWRPRLLSYGLALAIPWIAIDLMWQRDLSTQLDETRKLFGNKTVSEKHLGDIDSHIYSYATRLKDTVLPSSPARIFLIHAAPGHNFERLKTQYYLLPHNIYNFGHQPPSAAVRPGDYILALGNQPDMRFEERQGRLVWTDGYSLSISLADRDTRGALYRVNATAANPSGGTP